AGVLLIATLIGLEVSRRPPRATQGDTIEARNFVVLDAQGRARAVLQSMADPLGVQLVFFRDPISKDAWRDQAGQWPFSFGVRGWRGNAQMIVNARDGEQLTVLPTSLAMGGRGGISLLLSGEGGEGRIHLVDSTGAQTTFSAAGQRIVGSKTRRR